MLESYETFLSGGNGGRVPHKGQKQAAQDPNDSDTSLDLITPRRRPSPMPWKKPPASVNEEEAMAGFAKLLATAFQQLKKEDEDSGKRLPIKALETFNGSFTKFRRWWESINEYIAIHQMRVANDETKIYSLSTFLRDQAANWYTERRRLRKALYLDHNWVAFLAAMEEHFTNKQETGKDHEKLLALEYNCDMQTYLARFNELNSRVGLLGQALKRVLTAAEIPDIYCNIWRKYGKIPDVDADLLQAVREAVIEEEALARALLAKRSIARPQKEKEKEAAPKGKLEQKATTAKEKEKAPAVSTGGTGPNKIDKFPEKEILWESFRAAIKDTPEAEFEEHRKKEADCRRCGRDGHKRRAYYAQTTLTGTKLPPPLKMQSRQASAARTKRTQQDKPGKAEDNTAVIQDRPKKALKTAAAQRKVWEEESDTEGNPDTEMPDFH